MSAPRTNIETQQRRHWWPLAGMALAVLAIVIGAAIFFTGTSRGTQPEGAAVKIDGRTGQPEPAAPDVRPPDVPPAKSN